MQQLWMIVFFLFLATQAVADEFLLNADSSVADLGTGLVWQGNSSLKMSGSSAYNRCLYAQENSKYSWRLPTRSEMEILESRLFSLVPAAYWATDREYGSELIYFFGDGAHFSAVNFSSEAQVRCVAENPLAPIVEFLRVWTDVWKNNDVGGYLKSYEVNYQPVSGVPHGSWVKQRRTVLKNSNDISINLRIEKMSMLSKELVEVIFLQNYQSTRYHDRVRKRLLLSRQQGRWLIQREEQLSALPIEPLPTSASAF